MSVSDESRALAHYLRATWGGAPRILEHPNAAGTGGIDILEVDDNPVAGVVSMSTLGLSETPTAIGDGEVAVRIELAMAAYPRFEETSEILADCAFAITNDRFAIAPGAILPGVVQRCRPAGGLTDVLFMTPFLWELEPQTFQTMVVAWLLAVPISGAERAYAEHVGADTLEALLAHKQVDLFDLDRPSVV